MPSNVPSWFLRFSFVLPVLAGLTLLGCGGDAGPAGPSSGFGDGGKSGVDGGADGSTGGTTGTTSTGGTSGTSAGVSSSACPTTLAELSDQVLLPGCTGATCHSAADHAAGLDLETVDTLATEMLGVPSSLCQGETRIVPGDASSSLLVTKLDGTTSCGQQMPLGAPALSADTVACVAELVNQLSLTSCETCGGKACLDLTSDPMNCGGCGTQCPSGASCVDSACDCGGGLSACGGSCVDTQSDGAHCGDCTTDCGGQFCLSGSCAADCGSLTACGTSCVDTSSDDRNCGGCGTVCGTGTQCVAGACTCAGDAVSFASDLQPLFTASCTASGCHDSSGGGATTSGGGRGGKPGGGGVGGASSSLDLTAGNAYGSLMTTTSTCGTLVVPGDPDGSLLMGKLTGTQLCTGTQMPKGDAPWPQANLDLVGAWICQGAMDN